METDVLVIGSGIAGATAALAVAEDPGLDVTVLTRAPCPADSNSSMAQGGIVALGEDDSPELLARDVLAAGDGLGLPEAAEVLAAEGPGLVERLLVDDAGVRFDSRDGRPIFGLEGAHSRRRILHVGDATGRAIMEALLARLAERPNVRLLEQRTAVDLLTFPHHSRDPLSRYRPPRCHGAYVFDARQRAVEPVVARETVLATGGLGQIYLHTTNPVGARGDGLAMAYRAGARVINEEYVQFHPTALHMPRTTKWLVSEAVRGEGGVLLTPEGERFMRRYDPERLELATRDIVARAIYTEMVEHEYPYVLLDIASHRPGRFIRERFPEIHRRCLEQQIDITRDPIPVVPAAHYFCGGVLVDLFGRTTLPGLRAVGEVSCTGVHGANRLASTSLLEGLVWGVRAARDLRASWSESVRVREADVPAWDESDLTHDADPALIQGDLHAVRNVMWHYAGLLRSGFRLARAERELQDLRLTIEDFYRRAHLTDALIGLRNAALCALLVARAALHNTSSRGCHFRQDDSPAGA